jgi:putative addiction module component (TIGR02574 family)
MPFYNDSMSRTLEEIATEAMELSTEARAALAKRLLDSIGDPTAEEVEKSWVAEAGRRYRELKAGEAHSSPSEEVFQRLESRHRR